jgi:hypothetical protein
MSTLPTRLPVPQREPPAPPPWEWLLRPRAGRGYLRLGDELYEFTEVHFHYDNGRGGAVYSLRRFGGGYVYLTLDRSGELACSCADSGPRGYGCIHVRLLPQALRWLSLV